MVKKICLLFRRPEFNPWVGKNPWRREWQHILVFLTGEFHGQYSSVQFSHSVLSDSLWPHGLQHTSLPSPSPTPEACSKSCPSSRDAIQPSHPLISFSSRLPSSPALGSFTMSQFFTSGGQSTGVLASASVLPRNIQEWFPLGWTGWISL